MSEAQDQIDMDEEDGSSEEEEEELTEEPEAESEAASELQAAERSEEGPEGVEAPSQQHVQQLQQPSLQWFPNIWRTQTAQYAQIWVKHARVYEQLAKDITDFQGYIGEDVFRRLEKARHQGDLSAAMVLQARAELNRFEHSILRTKGRASQRMIGEDYDGLLQEWKWLSQHLLEALPKEETTIGNNSDEDDNGDQDLASNRNNNNDNNNNNNDNATDPDSFYSNLVQYKRYFDEARENRLRVLQVLEKHSLQQITNIQKILNIYLRILGVEEDLGAEENTGTSTLSTTTNDSNSAILLGGHERNIDGTNEYGDVVDQGATSSDVDSSVISVLLSGDYEASHGYRLDNTGKFFPLDTHTAVKTTKAAIFLPSSSQRHGRRLIGHHDLKSLWSLLNQLTHLRELEIDSLGPASIVDGCVCVSDVSLILQTVHPGHLRKVVVKPACWTNDNDNGVAQLGGILSGFPRCTHVCIRGLQGGSLETYNQMFRNIFPNTFPQQQQQDDDDDDDNNTNTNGGEPNVCFTTETKQQKREEDDAKYIVMHERCKASHAAPLLSFLLRNHFGPANSRAGRQLTMIRLDFLGGDSTDPMQFLQPLVDRMIQSSASSNGDRSGNNNKGLEKLGLYNVPSTDGLFLQRLLEEGVQRSVSLTRFAFHSQEPNKDITSKYSPTMKELLRKNVYLETFDVQGAGFAVDMEWEESRDLHLKLNRLGRRHLYKETATLEQDWIPVLYGARDDITALFCFLSHNPSRWTTCADSSRSVVDPHRHSLRAMEESDQDEDDLLLEELLTMELMNC